MNKQELSAMVAEILKTMGQEPQVKGSDYKPTAPQPKQEDTHLHDGDFVPDITALELRKLYLAIASVLTEFSDSCADFILHNLHLGYSVLLYLNNPKIQQKNQENLNYNVDITD